jgi:hypothetical protein
LLDGVASSEDNAPNTLFGSCSDGSSGTYHQDESVDRIRVMTVDGGQLTQGAQVRVEVDVWAWRTYTADTLDLYYAADADSPSWVAIGSFQPTASGAQTLSAEYTLPTGGLQAVRANFRYGGSASSCSTGNYDDHDDLYFAVAAGSGDTEPPTVSITSPAAGDTVTSPVGVTVAASDNVGVASVELLANGSSVGTDTTAPYSFTWSGAPGSHSLEAVATDAAGNVAYSTPVDITITDGNGTGEAVYDATYGAPVCSGNAASCDSMTLLDGVASSETNTPNTLFGSCADGTSGNYHVDESVDRITVSTVDGGPLAAGATVRVDATVYVWGTSADALDLYFAADADNPSWQEIATDMIPTSTGVQTMSATYTLPAGGLQAVRANFRYHGTPSPCSDGSFDDHDDLVFEVQ